jgi:hypothetical protein
MAVLSACEKENTGKTRLEAFRDRYTVSSRGTAVPGHDPEARDTIIYMSSVEFPDGYDWRRDTSYGEITGRLAVYRDNVRILEVPAGPGFLAGLDPDLHHLVDGHLFTESCTDAATVIGLDGEKLFSYPGRELLCGLLVEGNDVYTLGQSRTGRGLSLRRNGEELFSRSDGALAAHISDRVDYPTGALYRDGGHLYFSYWRPSSDGSGKEWFIVEDGTESRVAVPDDRIYDIRIRDGVPELSPVKPLYVSLYSYQEGDLKDVVAVSKAGKLTVYSPLWPASKHIDQPMLFLSFRNACLAGKSLYIAMNPLSGERPFLWRDGDTLFSLDINGFVTEVSVTL